MSARTPPPRGETVPPVDDDVRRAGTIDPRVAHDPRLHARALERVFVPSWQLLPVLEEAPAVTPFTLLPGGLDEPLVRTRDGRAERILSNVCTHRGALLAETPGDGSTLRCRYHGRRFDLDGRMTRCPGFEGAEAFPRDADDLVRLPLETAGPLAFTSLAPALGFDEWSAPLVETLAEFEGETLAYDASGSIAYDLDAGWSVYCENYLEGFHVPYVHPGLNAALDFGRYRTDLFPHAVRQVGFASGDEPRLRRANEPDQVADYLWLYPNLMVNAYAWGLSVNVVEPTGPGRCRVRYLRWIARPELVPRDSASGVGGALDQVEAEDQEVVLSVQRGVRSRLYPGGRFSPEHEAGPHRFHRLLARDLGTASSEDS